MSDNFEGISEVAKAHAGSTLVLSNLGWEGMNIACHVLPFNGSRLGCVVRCYTGKHLLFYSNLVFIIFINVSYLKSSLRISVIRYIVLNVKKKLNILYLNRLNITF